MTMKMRLKKKNTSHKYDINRPMPRYGHEYTKCIKCNIEAELKKKACSTTFNSFMMEVVII